LRGHFSRHQSGRTSADDRNLSFWQIWHDDRMARQLYGGLPQAQPAVQENMTRQITLH
jgi:hypothetical protein